jgi:hypothetical protein
MGVSSNLRRASGIVENVADNICVQQDTALHSPIPARGVTILAALISFFRTKKPLGNGASIEKREKIVPIVRLARQDHISGRLVAPDVDLITVESERRGQPDGLAAPVGEKLGALSYRTPLGYDLYHGRDHGKTPIQTGARRRSNVNGNSREASSRGIVTFPAVWP